MCGICGVALSSKSGAVVQRATLERMRDVLRTAVPTARASGSTAGSASGTGGSASWTATPASSHGQRRRRRGSCTTGRSTTTPRSCGAPGEGRPYRTRCDTESVLHLYEERGDGCVERAARHVRVRHLGPPDRAAVLARDRLGIKPLYYAVTEDARCLRLGDQGDPRASGDCGRDSTRRRSPSTSPALHLRGRHDVPRHPRVAGGPHPGVVATASIRIEPYWELPARSSTARRSDGEPIAEYRGRLGEAVRMRLMSRRPPRRLPLRRASTRAAIAAVMATMIEEPVRTFSVAFAEPSERAGLRAAGGRARSGPSIARSSCRPRSSSTPCRG